MDTRHLTVGSRIDHAQHGSGTVTFVGTDYLGIAFDGAEEALIRRNVLEQETPFPPQEEEPPRKELPWPESTFIHAPESANHFLGSHWEPFAEDSKDILGRLPEIVPQALPQTGYGEGRKPSRAEPDGWPKGFQLVWPRRQEGLALILCVENKRFTVVSVFPFSTNGGQHMLTLQEVTVWESGVEAQITASWGGGEVSFFDTQYPINRTWYETGKDYEFILAGVAYKAGPAEKREWTIEQHPDQVAWMNQRLKEGEAPHEASSTVTLDGAAVFLPISGWDIDDYSFRAPVKSVEEFKDWLGQDGWRVCATVMRDGDEDADLDILITRRAWSGEAPPQVGQDIEGRLWLQGYLWMPGESLRHAAGRLSR